MPLTLADENVGRNIDGRAFTDCWPHINRRHMFYLGSEIFMIYCPSISASYSK